MLENPFSHLLFTQVEVGAERLRNQEHRSYVSAFYMIRCNMGRSETLLPADPHINAALRFWLDVRFSGYRC